ncbi:MAG: exodeoxyribonuclease III [Candidatus Pacebacteria bacterium]|nr:exodeoxyribonuclease III [Candidatus Paceibacterota bacterium]
MNIISWNTNGLRGTIKNKMWEPFLKATGADVVCLQETKSEPTQLPEDFPGAGWHSAYSWSKLKKGYSGVSIFSKVKPIRFIDGMGIKKFDDEGRTIIAEYKNFYLINCYFPNGGGGPHRLEYKLEFYDAFLKFVEKLRKEKEVIFTGDVNTAHTEIDLARPKENMENTGFLPVERAWIDKVVSKGFVDVWRSFFPDKKDVYTYWDQKTRARDRNVGWRIDYFFGSPKIYKKINKISVYGDVFGSDHCPIGISVD